MQRPLAYYAETLPHCHLLKQLTYIIFNISLNLGALSLGSKLEALGGHLVGLCQGPDLLGGSYVRFLGVLLTSIFSGFFDS